MPYIADMNKLVWICFGGEREEGSVGYFFAKQAKSQRSFFFFFHWPGKHSYLEDGFPLWIYRLHIEINVELGLLNKAICILCRHCSK